MLGSENRFVEQTSKLGKSYHIREIFSFVKM